MTFQLVFFGSMLCLYVLIDKCLLLGKDVPPSSWNYSFQSGKLSICFLRGGNLDVSSYISSLMGQTGKINEVS